MVLSKGKAAVGIPDVRGIAASDAQAQLEALGFSVTQQEEASTTVDEGVVIRSEPDTSAPTGSDITLVVSLGDVVTIPDVFQADVQDAVAQLTEAGVEVRNVSAQSCAFIQRRDTEFDCDTFPDNGVGLRHVAMGRCRAARFPNRYCLLRFKPVAAMGRMSAGWASEHANTARSALGTGGAAGVWRAAVRHLARGAARAGAARAGDRGATLGPARGRRRARAHHQRA